MAGNSKGTRRRFGSVRQLSSGRWQARYPDPRTNQSRPADRSFATKRDAEIWLSRVEADISRGEWSDPDAGRVPFRQFAVAWVAERDLSETTRERYEGLLRNYLVPEFGETDLCDIKPAQVRRWRADRLAGGSGSATVAKAYRLLRAICNTAVDDELIKRNPCRIKGADLDSSAERTVLTVDQVYGLAEAIGPRYRALVLLAAFSGLRFGELAALRRSDVDLVAGDVRVRFSQAELQQGRVIVKGPKSEAGKRTVAVPAALVSELRRHLQWFSGPGPNGVVFLGPLGGHLRRRNFHRLWTKAVAAVGLGDSDVHFHDLRHTGNNLAAATGASTRELMARLGHSSVRAALIYQHATRDRDREIAHGVDERIQQARTKPTGADLARIWHDSDLAAEEADSASGENPR